MLEGYEQRECDVKMVGGLENKKRGTFIHDQVGSQFPSSFVD